jgi:hypothetical protein
MRIHKGRAAAVGILCVVAATVTLWSGPLSAVSGALHSSAQAQAQVHDAGHSGHSGR